MAAHRWTVDRAFGLAPAGELVAIVGGGGKTSLLFALAAALPGRVVVTTTTRIFAAQMSLAPAVCDASDLSALGRLLADHRICLVVGDIAGEKATGVNPDVPAHLLARPDVDTVLVEADGSRMRPFKAPASHEPVIPQGTTLLIPVAGMDALERPLADVTHRPEQVATLLAKPTSWPPERHLTPAEMAAVLAHEQGGLKHIPDGVRAAVFLNKAETPARQAAAASVARHLLQAPRIERAVVGALQAPEPVSAVYRRVTAVVLAAGEASRMGGEKMALPWGNSTILGQTVANVEKTGVDDILVVTGHNAHRTTEIAQAAGARTIDNPDYRQGMLSSVQRGVGNLPDSCAAVLIVLGDQPMVRPETMDALIAAWLEQDASLIAPVHEGQRGNPVLIDRRHFRELLALPVGDAPRTLLRHHPDDLLLMPVDDPAIHLDLDLPEAYTRWRPDSTA